MGRLFAYGCSFTQGMWEFDESSSGTDEYKGVGSSHQFEYNTKKNWVRLLGESLDLHVENKGFEGSGVLYAIHCIHRDMFMYKEGDVVIIQISYGERKFSHLHRFSPPHSQQKHTEWLAKTPEWIGADDTFRMEWVYLRSIFETLQKLKIKIHFWSTEPLPTEYDLNQYEHLRLTFDETPHYLNWIESKKEMYYDYEWIGKGAADIHQNEVSHMAQSLIFKRQIEKCE